VDITSASGTEDTGSNPARVLGLVGKSYIFQKIHNLASPLLQNATVQFYFVEARITEWKVSERQIVDQLNFLPDVLSISQFAEVPNCRIFHVAQMSNC
jgi:hypothetical protein